MKYLLLALLFLLGCQSTPPTTELLVVVDSDVQPALSALHVEVFDRAGLTKLATHDFELADELPLSFSLYPVKDASELRLVVTGRSNGTDVVEKQVLASFRHEQRWLLSVFLAQSCVDQLCRDDDGARSDSTCSNGSCGPTTEATLTPARGGPLGGYAGMDAGRSTMDARVRDAQAQDAGDSATGCVNDSDCAPLLGELDPPGCAEARCSAGECVFEAVDADGDGDRASKCSAAVDVSLGMDCDDDDPTVSSGKDAPCSALPDGTPIVWPAGSPVGACKAGTRSCVAGEFSACLGAVAPKASDRCEVADDDSNCNGTRSENCQCTDGATRPCGSTVGSCKAGVQTCTNGRWGSTCAGSVTPANADTCEPNNDANCNGTTNDGCTCVNGAMSTCGQVLPALGDCLERVVTCSGGEWPAATCNAQCNDCPPTNTCAPGSCVDGQHDYSCMCPPGSSGSGSKACSAIDRCLGVSACGPGTCVSGATTFSCTCPPGYSGTGTQACTFQPLICGGAYMGMDSGTGIACGPHTHCRNGADGGVLGCECDTGFSAVANSNPPACI